MLNQSHVDSAYATHVNGLAQYRNLGPSPEARIYVNFPNPIRVSGGTIQIRTSRLW